MKKFLAIYHVPAEVMASLPESTPEQHEASMKKWMDWKAAHEENVVDFGSPLAAKGPVGNGDKHSSISGYSVLQAKDLDTVKAICKDHPHSGWHEKAYIELFEFTDM